jgi:small subunit ribosomal protein S17
MPKKVLVGKVLRTGKKTAYVLVWRTVKHEKYNKIMRRFSKYAVHDEEERCIKGSTVTIIESRPISKTKRWAVQYA